MFNLSHKTALVTGASGSLGAAIATLLHERGAFVILSGTRREALDSLAQTLAERVLVLPCDLSKEEETNALIAQAEESVGHIDILVNNAGLTADGLLLRMKDEDWARVLEVNLTATFRLTRAVLRSMMKNRFGRILNITSVVGVAGNAGQTNYAASKAGLIGFSKSLALEVASRGITVNCIAPGFIDSPMTSILSETTKEQILKSIPLGQMGIAKDIANAALFLASDESSYITGQTLHVNGGMLMV
ncbi:MAG: beta-ketoacyl-ACP reductase [Alphaproteobacteria bacterium 16-39-46]|nr:MAG: beta-ketoacyl-ACP reductase [Alphaproteobacteria bacterium 16-39-46]OZA42692.1 MAG: beta-ketoacyl-ACP reductase [Alphaproteobacteria bacterium 17-39-52]HQS84344.1 3-oxoacyl-[acyl-carrier-protein] reductase [Alphaproteobacteria bacterium]HQS94170.1 3-oxoacyl-[acyl-carrier-protein] reductase [Alphaproteobacteria bacterium]